MSLKIFIHKNNVLEITIVTMSAYILKIINNKNCDPQINTGVPRGVQSLI